MDLIELYRRWLQCRADSRELDALGPEGRALLARDVFVTPEVLSRGSRTLAGSPPGLPRLMRSLGLDPAGVERRFSSVMRDMQVVCAGCAEAKHCGTDLESANGGLAIEGYCPNATTLKALRGEDLPRRADA